MRFRQPSHRYTQRWLAMGALAVLSLAGCGDEIDHAAALRERVAASDVVVRRAAIEELAQMGALSDENLALVEQALADDDALVRRAAATTLVQQTSDRPELAPRLVEWAAQAGDAQCREMLEQAAVGKPLAIIDE